MTPRIGVITNWDVIEEQLMFYRSHLDIFVEDAFSPIKLTRDQHIILRQMGNCIDSKDTCSRGFGKTWLASLGGFSICALYPGTTVLVVSATAKQATLALGKLKLLAEQNSNIANEINASNSKSLVQVSKDSSSCTLKNGSKLISASIDSARGIRAKVIRPVNSFPLLKGSQTRLTGKPKQKCMAIPWESSFDEACIDYLRIGRVEPLLAHGSKRVSAKAVRYSQSLVKTRILA